MDLSHTKAVMLCGTPGGVVEQLSKGPGPFLSGKVPAELGITHVKKEEEEHKQHTVPICHAAQQQHREYLRDLAAKIKQVKKELDNDSAETQSKIRVATKAREQREAVKELVKQEQMTVDNLTQVFIPSAKTITKPQWALTSEQAAVAEKADDDELLDFVSNLPSFDDYLEDLEIRQALLVLKDRCGRIEREQQAWREALVNEFNEEEHAAVPADDDDDAKSLTSAAALAREVWNSSVREQDAAHDTPRDPVVQALLTEDLFKTKHSAASLNNIINSVREQGAPLIVVHREEPKAADASGLPYLHRSPAV